MTRLVEYRATPRKVVCWFCGVTRDDEAYYLFNGKHHGMVVCQDCMVRLRDQLDGLKEATNDDWRTCHGIRD